MSKLTEKLRSYSPTSGYSKWMYAAADEIDRLNIQLIEERAKLSSIDKIINPHKITNAPTFTDEELKEEVKKLLIEDGKIAAIKLVRKELDMSLKEAINYVNEVKHERIQ